MTTNFAYWFHSRWRAFIYNYCWSDWVNFIDGWIPRFSLFFPIVGYLIVINDSVAEWLSFDLLTGNDLTWGLSGNSRLRFLYFGLLFLGLSNFLYRLWRPFLFRFGTNLVDYTRVGLEFFTFGDFSQMHGRIRHEGHISIDGKYYDSEWDGFADAAKNTDEGRDTVVRDGNWENARRQYGGLLRSILREEFYHQDRGRRACLTVCLFLSSVGYSLLVIPGADLFIKVLMSTLSALLR